MTSAKGLVPEATPDRRGLHGYAIAACLAFDDPRSCGDDRIGGRPVDYTLACELEHTQLTSKPHTTHLDQRQRIVEPGSMRVYFKLPVLLAASMWCAM